MASGMYHAGSAAISSGSINYLTDDIRVLFIDPGYYTANLTTDSSLSNIPSVARKAVSGSLTGKAITSGSMADANDILVTTVHGYPGEVLVIYKHTGTDSTATLIAYMDSGTNLPFTPNGGNALIQWDPTGIFPVI